MTSTDLAETNIEHADCSLPLWDEWWPEAWERRDLDNADAEVPSPLP